MGLGQPAVGRPSKPALEPTISARAERRAMIALLAVFALLVQALIPSLAMAGPLPMAGKGVAVCTDHGLMAQAPGDPAPAKGQAAPPCDHCVCPPVAALTAQLQFATAIVRIAVRTEPPAIADVRLLPPARAPPRPPGQGPPSSDA